MTEVRRDSFESLVARPDTHVVLDLATESRSLLILFGGIAGGVSMPVFEFFRLTSDFPAQKAFLRDPRRGWYQLGIPGVGDSAAQVRDLLTTIIANANAERVVMAGASAGGYAALLFGALCAVDEVIAFSPQTFVDAQNRARAGDNRWPGQIDALHSLAPNRALALDLLDVAPMNPGETRYQIHVSSDDALDMLHAQRLASWTGIEIVEHANGGHRLVKTLRDRGVLRPLLLDALATRQAAEQPEAASMPEMESG
ncbi:MAG: hypothetical protein ACRDJC_16755 [Thermomicrobiales bacterium]